MNDLREADTGLIKSPYPEDRVDARFCPDCEGWLPKIEFYADRRTRSGLTRRCRTHHSKGSYAARKRSKQFDTPSKRYDYNRSRLLDSYGLTQEAYDNLFASQGNACAICQRKDSIGNGWVIDHDHSCCPVQGVRKRCGKCVRGILCTNCNTALGKFRDDPAILRRALLYIGADAPLTP